MSNAAGKRPRRSTETPPSDEDARLRRILRREIDRLGASGPAERSPNYRSTSASGNNLAAAIDPEPQKTHTRCAREVSVVASRPSRSDRLTPVVEW